VGCGFPFYLVNLVFWVGRVGGGGGREFSTCPMKCVLEGFC